MSNDPFFDRLRSEGVSLQYQPADDFAFTRISAAIRERVNAPLTVAQFLAVWFRPVVASLGALALCASLGITWLSRSQEAVASEQVASSTLQIQMDGDVYSVSE